MTNKIPVSAPANPYPNDLEPGDSCYGTVANATRKGLYISLDNGAVCFSYDCANLRPGSRVLCSFRRPLQENRYWPLVRVDSVLEYAPLGLRGKGEMSGAFR